MGVFTDLFKDVVKTGPENVKKLINALDSLPNDETLMKIAETLEKFSPLIPELQRALQNGTLDKVVANMATMPDKATLNKLVKLAPMMEKIPDKATLNRLLDKADEMKSFIEGMET